MTNYLSIIQSINIMFNNYLAKKREQANRKILLSFNSEVSWKQKYQKTIQPQLLANYKQRVRSFMHQVTQQPIIIKDANPSKTDKKSIDNFKFKTCEDWKKTYDTFEKPSFIKNSILQSQKSVKQKNSRAKEAVHFAKIKTEFRTRDKGKQINKPMKFSVNNDSFERQGRQRHKSLVLVRQKQKQQPAYLGDIDSFDKEKTSTKQFDNISDFFEYRRVDDAEFESDMEIKKVHLKENKWHFKKLMSMLMIGEAKQKIQVKEILSKCEYIKKKDRNVCQSSDIDQFAKIIQRVKQR